MSKKPAPKIITSLYPRTRGPYSWELGSICFDKHEKGYSKNVKGFLKNQ